MISYCIAVYRPLYATMLIADLVKKAGKAGRSGKAGRE